MTPAVKAALVDLDLTGARRVRPAAVIVCGRSPERATSAIKYTRDPAVDAWYADLRAKQAVGS